MGIGVTVKFTKKKDRRLLQEILKQEEKVRQEIVKLHHHHQELSLQIFLTNFCQSSQTWVGV